MRKLMMLGAMACVGWMASASVLADDAPLSDRMARMKETNTVVLAYRESGLPFSYLTETGKPVGYGVDISLKVVEALKVRLGAPNLKVRWNAVTASTRFPLMVTDTVDMECGQTTNTQARHARVAFSNTFYVSEEGIAVRAGSDIQDYPGLMGKRVAVVANTTTETALRARSAGKAEGDRAKGEKPARIEVVPVRSNSNGLQALAAGRVDALVASKPLLSGVIANQDNPAQFAIVGSGGYKEAFGCMLPKDDPALKTLVDGVLAGMMQSGEMAALYEKWFQRPVPPRNVNLNLPMNEDTRAAFATPNDRPLE